MQEKRCFDKYYKKLVVEGIIKALICSLIVGFALSIVPAVVGLLTNHNGLWLSLVVLFVATAACSPAFYFALFRPDVRLIAKRVDRQGLDERAITMLELEKDDSYIALKQREDAKIHLSRASQRKRFRISVFRKTVFKVLLVMLAVMSVTSVSTMVATAVSVDGMMPWYSSGTGRPGTGIQPPVDRNFFYVSFEVDGHGDDFGGGYIEGITEQKVFFALGDEIEYRVRMRNALGYPLYDLDGNPSFEYRVRNQIYGENTTIVRAVPHLRNRFVRWEWDELHLSEEYGWESIAQTCNEPEMLIHNVQHDMLILAVFAPVGDGEGDNGSGSGQQNPPPSDPGQGHRDNLENQTIDGRTYYREVLQRFYDDAMQMIADGRDVPPHILEFVRIFREIIA